MINSFTLFDMLFYLSISKWIIQLTPIIITFNAQNYYIQHNGTFSNPFQSKSSKLHETPWMNANCQRRVQILVLITVTTSLISIGHWMWMLNRVAAVLAVSKVAVPDKRHLVNRSDFRTADTSADGCTSTRRVWDVEEWPQTESDHSWSDMLWVVESSLISTFETICLYFHPHSDSKYLLSSQSPSGLQMGPKQGSPPSIWSAVISVHTFLVRYIWIWS